MTQPFFRDPKKSLSQFLSNPLPTCAVCNTPVQIESAKTDESGAAIHELCYVLRVQSNIGGPS